MEFRLGKGVLKRAKFPNTRTVLGLPIVGASLVVEHGLYGARGSVAVVPRL